MRSSDIGLLLMRVALGFIFLWNGIPKIINPQMAIESFSGYGLLGILGPIIGIVSIISAIFVVFGIQFKLGNFLMMGIALVAIFTVHIKEGVTIGFERNILIAATTFFLFYFGPGKYILTKNKKTKTRKIKQE